MGDRNAAVKKTEHPLLEWRRFPRKLKKMACYCPRLMTPFWLHARNRQKLMIWRTLFSSGQGKGCCLLDPSAQNTMMLDEAAHGGRANCDPSLLLNKFAELLKRGGRMKVNELSNSVNAEKG